MRKFLSLLSIGFLIFSFSLSGCKEDEETYSFTYDGKSYEISKAYFSAEEAIAKVAPSLQNVFLCPSTITYNTTTEFFEGKGDIVWLMFYSEESYLAPGSYLYANDDMFGVLVKNFDSESEIDPTFYEIHPEGPGSVDVTKSGDTYEFDFSFNLESNKIVKGKYKGTMTEIQFMPDKSTGKFLPE